MRRSASTPRRVCCNWATDSRAAIQSAGDPLPLRAADSLACTSRRASPSCSWSNARRCSKAWRSNHAMAVSRPMVAVCSRRPASAVCASRSKRAVRAWRLAALGKVCISETDLAVMKSRVVLYRSGPDSGTLSSDRRKTGSGRWPAATAVSLAERAAASWATRAGERASAAWTACGNDSGSAACAMGEVARPIRTAMCTGAIAVRQRAMNWPRRRPSPPKAGERGSMFLLRKNAHGLSTRRDARLPLADHRPGFRGRVVSGWKRQSREGGRQMLAGEPRSGSGSAGACSSLTGSVCAKAMTGGATKPVGAWHSCPVLHILPVS